MCQNWGQLHPEIKQDAMILITACMVNKHWIPLFMYPHGSTLFVRTWDSPGHDHTAVGEMCEMLAKSLGFESATYERHHRMFFASDKCGALAMAFLSYSLRATMLPTSKEEVEVIHQRLRDMYKNSIAMNPLATRPWVWGAGDSEAPKCCRASPVACALQIHTGLASMHFTGRPP